MIKRTPPASPLVTAATPTTTALQAPHLQGMTSMELSSFAMASDERAHHGSAPDLHDLLNNITERKKRKFDETDNNIGIMMKQMFDSFSKEQEKRFKDLKSTIDELKNQNKELTNSVEWMSKKYDEFLEKIIILEKDRKEDKKIIKDLEEKLETLERKSRSTGIEIRNIPKPQGENKDELCKTVKKVLTTLNIEVQTNDIKDTFRLNAKDSSHPIVAEFTTVLMKDKVLKSVKEYNKNKTKNDKLNTKAIDLPEPAKPIYISESLTYKTQRLYYLARVFQRDHGYDFCWTSQGIVYLRKKEKLPQIRISSEADLEAIKKQ